MINKNIFQSIIVALIMLLPAALLGQQHTLFSHYNFDHFMFNPGAAGNVDGLNGNVFYRNQWTGFDRAPKTIFADLHGGLGRSNFALGGQILNDRAGFLNNTKIALAPAYRFDIGYSGKLGVGVGLNLQRLNLDSGYIIVDPTDNLVNTYLDGIWNFYFNPGLYYSDEEFYAGLSVPQVLENNWSVNDVLTNPEVSRRHLLALIGYDYQINDQWSINPSLLARIERAAPFNFDVNAALTYDDVVWLNLGYRSSKMIMAGIGVNINKLFKFGYTYDHNLNPLGALKARGSHELFGGFNISPSIDTDKDGIIDKLDKCPNEKGVAKYAGCPPPAPKDTDKDGIIDKDDKCPREFGPRSNDGCPVVIEKDSDGDGILDKNDECPNVKGVARNKGCPEVVVPTPAPVPVVIDSDGDGINDDVDNCPNIYGSASRNGCPEPAPAPTPVPVVVDSDGDGIADADDRCPNTYGTYANGGCPAAVEYVSDRDGDGVVDTNDRCPDSYGTVNNNGCPEPASIDSDGDGITDMYDNCPNTYGSSSNNGCPSSADSDGDGVPDSEDRCPNSYGAASNGGCPIQQVIDSDGDGVADSEDRCPNTFGSYSNSGCPDVSYEQQQVITRAFDNLLFETGSAIIKYSSLSSLNDLAKLLVDNPSYRLRIAGHTDNTGSASANLEISRKRSEAVRDYLLNKGVSFGNMVVEYYGDTQPIYDNNTADGRRKNRRVEFELMTY